MTNEQAKKMLKAKLECLKREISGIDCNDGYNCDECELLYAQGTAGEQKEALDMAIKALEQKSVLDNIKAEILDEAEYAYADFDRYKEDILHAEPDELPDDDFRYGLERAVEIINKYKYKSESENEG